MFALDTELNNVVYICPLREQSYLRKILCLKPAFASSPQFIRFVCTEEENTCRIHIAMSDKKDFLEGRPRCDVVGDRSHTAVKCLAYNGQGKDSQRRKCGFQP